MLDTLKTVLSDSISVAVGGYMFVEEEINNTDMFGEWKWLIYGLTVLYFALRARTEYYKGNREKNGSINK